MRTISLLDCTLRDGGYVNDWNFGRGTSLSIINRLIEAGVDYVEVGFLDERRSFDINRTIQPNTESMMKLFGNIDKKQSKMVAMIDYGTCGINNIQECSKTNLDAIRLIFKKEKIEGALPFAKELQSKGYKVFLQLVSITAYSDKDLLYLIDRANEIVPFAVSIVDTYGLLHKEQLLHYFELLDHNLSEDIVIGYHSHNNFQLGYSNSIAFLEHRSNRNVLVDGTLYGMGKSAGNAPLELLAMHLNNVYFKQYSIASLLEAIDNNVMSIYRKKPWGYSYIFYISAVNDCHPNYVTFLLEKNTLSVNSVCSILDDIPKEKKLLYDKTLIENLYNQYQCKLVDDSEAIASLDRIIRNRIVLLLGPGKTLVSNKKEIDEIIEGLDPVIISLNTAPSAYNFNYVFLTSSKRYNFDYQNLYKHQGKTIATSNITAINGEFKYVINYEKLSSLLGEGNDSSLLLMLQLLKALNPKQTLLAGFDGFSEELSDNYYDSMIAIDIKKSGNTINEAMRKSINEFKKYIDIKFVTPSKYCD